MCLDVTNAQIAVKKYEDAFPRFNDSRECQLVTTLIQKVEDNDPDGFTAAVADYDAISPLDPWYSNLLLRIKQGFESDVDLK